MTYTLNIMHYHRVITNKHPSITHSKGLLFAIWLTFVHSFIPCPACSESKWTLMTVILIIVRCWAPPRFLAVTEGFARSWGRDSRVGEALGGRRCHEVLQWSSCAWLHACFPYTMCAWLLHPLWSSSQPCRSAWAVKGWTHAVILHLCVCVILGQPFPWNVPPPAK